MMLLSNTAFKSSRLFLLPLFWLFLSTYSFLSLQYSEILYVVFYLSLLSPIPPFSKLFSVAIFVLPYLLLPFIISCSFTPLPLLCLLILHVFFSIFFLFFLLLSLFSFLLSHSYSCPFFSFLYNVYIIMLFFPLRFLVFYDALNKSRIQIIVNITSSVFIFCDM
jgi:hypothetical protein